MNDTQNTTSSTSVLRYDSYIDEEEEEMKRKLQYMVCGDCRMPLTKEEVYFYVVKTSTTITKISYCRDCMSKLREDK